MGEGQTLEPRYRTGPLLTRPGASGRLALAVALALLVGAPARGQSALGRRLDDLLVGLPKDTTVALVVADADSGRLRYQREADTLLKPASVQKLFITAAALVHLGPTFAYETRAYAPPNELWIVGAGDPALGDERVAARHGREPDHLFDEWAAALRARGMVSLEKVVLDDAIFDEQVRHPDWPDDQADRWYQAPVGALNYNDNCLDIDVVPRGSSIDLRLRPALPAALVSNNLRRGDQQRPILRRAAGSDTFELSGTVTVGGKLPAACARQPTLFFAQALKAELRRRGIDVRGNVVRRRLTPAELAAAPLLGVHKTPLADVIWRCNAFSQNLFAECLMKSLAAYEAGGRRAAAGGGWDAGREVLRETLTRLGVAAEGATFRDGSGLSHANRLTASQVVSLLVGMRRDPRAGEFLASLAEPGHAGSMGRRYDEPLLRGRLRGKTGTIAGVHTLAGYVSRPDGSDLAFALLISGRAKRSLQLEVCRVLASADADN